MIETLLSTAVKPGAVDDDRGVPFPGGTPYKGVVPSADFIDGPSLAGLIGLTTGDSYNDNAGWLHFIDTDGYEVYIAKKPLRTRLLYTDIMAATDNGRKEVVIRGETYVCTLMTGCITPGGGAGGGNSNLGGDWNKYIQPVYNTSDRSKIPSAPIWGNYTAAMLGIATVPGSTERGSQTYTADAADSTWSSVLTRGATQNGGATYSDNIADAWSTPVSGGPYSYHGWRPMLVKKSSIIYYTPYKGEVTAANFINGAGLAAAIGLSEGNLANNNTPWMKFVDNGKTFYMPVKNLRNNVTWLTLNGLGAVAGTKTIVINGLTYKVRLMTGMTTDPGTTGGGEYDNYFARATVNHSVISERYARYMNTDIDYRGMIGNGDFTLVKEVYSSGNYGVRGYPGFYGVWYQPGGSVDPAHGWRPVLELVP